MLFFTSKCYNFAIYVVNFFKKNSHIILNSLMQNPTVEKKNKMFRNQFMQFTLEVVVLECL